MTATTKASPPLPAPVANAVQRWLLACALLPVLLLIWSLVAGWSELAQYRTALLAALVGLGLVGWRSHQHATMNRQLREGLDALDEGFAMFDDAQRLIVVNEGYKRAFPRLSGAWSEGMSLPEMLDRMARSGEITGAIGREEEWAGERLEQITAPSEPSLQAMTDGSWIRVQMHRTAGGDVVGLRADVTELVVKERALQASQAQLRAIIGTAGVAIITLDAEGRMLSANPTTERTLGYAENDLVGQPVTMLVDTAMRNVVESFLRLYMSREEPSDGRALLGQQRELPVLHRSGRELTMQLALASIRSGDGPVFVAVLTDITERKRYEVELQHANEQLLRLSTTDALTDLGNRRLLMQRLEDEWRRALRSNEPLSMLLIDVDHFKLYNDHYGHPAGDKCLQAVARVLQDNAARPSDLAARYGGEEFVLLLPATDADGAQTVVTRIDAAIRNAQIEHSLSPIGPYLTVSMGLVSGQASAVTSPTQWLAQADLALYQAKALGRNRVVRAQGY